MAIGAARSVFQSSTVRNAAARFASRPKASPFPFRLPSRNPLAQRISRSPVEMSTCVVSMQPYHTATASALMTSMLTVTRCGFGWLPEAVTIFTGGFYRSVLLSCIQVSSNAFRALFCCLPYFMFWL